MSKRVHLTLSLNPNGELDREILRWISGIPRRYRSTAVKAVLYAWLKNRTVGVQAQQVRAVGQPLDQLSERLLELFEI